MTPEAALLPGPLLLLFLLPLLLLCLSSEMALDLPGAAAAARRADRLLRFLASLERGKTAERLLTPPASK
jgi:hypothetical protein